jgi:hypothetical protein
VNDRRALLAAFATALLLFLAGHSKLDRQHRQYREEVKKKKCFLGASRRHFGLQQSLFWLF